MNELEQLYMYRTVRNWKPMRFGGGLGGRKAIKSKKQLAEEALKSAAELVHLSLSFIHTVHAYINACIHYIQTIYCM